ncbi:MAG: two-component regulator propeller domain-containing protein, partial [Chitinophagales bacterium]
IGTRDGGITRFDLNAPLAKQFTRFSNIPGDSTTMFSNRITTLAELNSDYIVFSAEGISTGFINRKTFEISYHESKNKSVALLDTKITKPKPDGNSWMQLIKRDGNTIYLSGLIGGTVYAFDANNPVVPANHTDGSASSIQNFDVDGDTIWVGGWKHGLFMQENPLDNPNDKPLALKKVVPIEAEVLSVLSWDKNFVLAGSKGIGLYVVNKKTFEYKVIQHDRADAFSLAGNKINCLLKDSNGILWVGTSAGLSKYNTIQWQFNATLIKDDFTKEITHFSIFEFNDHTFGINTGMGLFRYYPENQTFTQHHFNFYGVEINPTAIVAISEDKHYLTTETNTFLIDLKTLQIKEISPKTVCNPVLDTCYRTKDILFGNYQVYDVLFDTLDNHILHFFTTIGSGIGIYDATDDAYYNLFQYTNKPNSISNNFVRNIYRDSKGNIWVSTSEGLNKWNKSFPIKNDFTIYKHSITDSNSISHNNISAVWEAPDGILWIATSNGLNAFDGKNFTRYYNTVNGLQQMFGLY